MCILLVVSYVSGILWRYISKTFEYKWETVFFPRSWYGKIVVCQLWWWQHGYTYFSEDLHISNYIRANFHVFRTHRELYRIWDTRVHKNTLTLIYIVWFTSWRCLREFGYFVFTIDKNRFCFVNLDSEFRVMCVFCFKWKSISYEKKRNFETSTRSDQMNEHINQESYSTRTTAFCENHIYDIGSTWPWTTWQW